MAVGTLVSRGTGFLRTLVLVYAVGIGALGNAYNNANTLPNTVYYLMLGGIFTSVVVPLLVRAARRDPDRGEAYAQRMFTLGAVALPLNGLLDYVLMKKWGCFGISLSTSIVYCVTSTVLYIYLQKRIGTILNRSIWRVILGSVLASIGAGGCLWAVVFAIPNEGLGTALGGLCFAAILMSSYAGFGFVARTPFGIVFLPARSFPETVTPTRMPKAAS